MKRYFLPAAGVLLSACSAGWHARDVQDATGGTGRLTAGTVQRSIRVGMTSAEVISILGAPNIVSTDDQRREVWVYDKIATDVAYSSSSGYSTLLLLGGTGEAAARSTNQRTLTIAIKFDEQHRVRDFSYHQSSF
ncbi:MAG TPA: hypothetical protein VNL74_00060 [Methylococcus sp.]|nr:hypothetical protein [Methylococcus sp.]